VVNAIRTARTKTLNCVKNALSLEENGYIMKKINRKETDIQLEICKYLKMRGYFFWRQNTAPTFQRSRNCYRSMPKFAINGVPDILLVKEGRFIGIEVKSLTGRISKNQVIFRDLVIEAGGEYFIARSVEDVIKAGL